MRRSPWTLSILLVACGAAARATPAMHEAAPSFYSAAWLSPPVEEASPIEPGPSGFTPQFRIRPGGTVHSAALSPDARLVAVATEGSITVWNVATRDVAIVWTAPAEACQVAFSADASRVLGACSTFTVGEGGGYTRDGGVVMWRVDRAEPLWSNHTGWVADGAFSPRGDLIAIHDGTAAHILDAATGREVRRWAAEDGGQRPSVTFSSDGTLLAVSSGEAVVVYASLDGEARAQIASRSDTLRFSPGDALLVATRDGVELWDAVTGQSRSILPGTSRSPVPIAFSPDGSLLASEGLDGTVLLSDPSAAQLIDTLSGPSAAGNTLTFSSDGRWLAGSYADVVVIWRRP